MEQDLRTCPGCGAPSSEHPSCPYCGWTPNLSEEPNLDPIESIESGSAQFRELVEPGRDPEHLLDQVPEEMRGVLAARLKAAENSSTPTFSETTASSLQKQGYIVSQDAPVQAVGLPPPNIPPARTAAGPPIYLKNPT